MFVIPRELRDLSYVPRWSIVRVAKPQSVAEHSFYTAVYAAYFADMIGWRYRGSREQLLLAALWHDAEEQFVGDIPGPAKHLGLVALDRKKITDEMLRRFGVAWVTSATTEEKDIVKAASLLDDALFLCGEIQRGNKACHDAYLSIYVRLRQAVLSLPAHPNTLDQVWKTVDESLTRETHGFSKEIGSVDTQG
jgi:5'-deoxynucleotidase YfbR-like HD superfamily hydrolase